MKNVTYTIQHKNFADSRWRVLGTKRPEAAFFANRTHTLIKYCLFGPLSPNRQPVHELALVAFFAGPEKKRVNSSFR